VQYSFVAAWKAFGLTPSRPWNYQSQVFAFFTVAYRACIVIVLLCALRQDMARPIENSHLRAGTSFRPGGPRCQRHRPSGRAAQCVKDRNRQENQARWFSELYRAKMRAVVPTDRFVWASLAATSVLFWLYASTCNDASSIRLPLSVWLSCAGSALAFLRTVSFASSAWMAYVARITMTSFDDRWMTNDVTLQSLEFVGQCSADAASAQVWLFGAIFASLLFWWQSDNLSNIERRMSPFQQSFEPSRPEYYYSVSGNYRALHTRYGYAIFSRVPMFSSWCALVLTVAGSNLRLWRGFARLISSAAFRSSVLPDHRIQRWKVLRRTEQLIEKAFDRSSCLVELPGRSPVEGVLVGWRMAVDGYIVMRQVGMCFRCLWIIPSLMAASLGDQPITACLGWTCAVSSALYGGWRARAHALQVAADGMSKRAAKGAADVRAVDERQQGGAEAAADGVQQPMVNM